MEHKKPIIALAPIRYYDLHKTNNVEKIKRYLKLAKKAKADIVCFPETCIKKNDRPSLTDKCIKAIQTECKRNSIWCIVTENIKIGDKAYNMSLLIDREGKIKGNYKKINLCGDYCVSPGNQIKVFKTDFAKIGLAICWDLADPGLFEVLRSKGAEIVFCPAQWNYDLQSHHSRPRHQEAQLLKSMVLARAYENVFYVALCTPLLDEKTHVSYSAIACPHRILKESIDNEELITAEVDLKEIKKFRKLYFK